MAKLSLGLKISEIAAIYILGLYTIAFVAFLAWDKTIPWALNIAMPGAAGALLGINLITSTKGKPNGG